MKYIAAATSVTDMTSECIMASIIDKRKKTGERTAITMIIEGDINGKFSYDHDLGMVGPMSNKKTTSKEMQRKPCSLNTNYMLSIPFQLMRTPSKDMLTQELYMRAKMTGPNHGLAQK